MNNAERQKYIRAKIDEVQQDFYAPLLGLTILNLFPEFSNEKIIDAVLSTYKQLEEE